MSLASVYSRGMGVLCFFSNIFDRRFPPATMVAFVPSCELHHAAACTSQDSQIAEVTHVVSKAFKDFNVSVGAVSEVVDEDFGDKHGPAVLQGWVPQP